jgi:hypothetical protein
VPRRSRPADVVTLNERLRRVGVRPFGHALANDRLSRKANLPRPAGGAGCWRISSTSASRARYLHIPILGQLAPTQLPLAMLSNRVRCSSRFRRQRPGTRRYRWASPNRYNSLMKPGEGAMKKDPAASADPRMSRAVGISGNGPLPRERNCRSGRTCGLEKRSLSHGEPRVRIPLPPAESPKSRRPIGITEFLRGKILV